MNGGQTSCATEPPNSHPAPRGLTAQFSTSSGSDHIRSMMFHHKTLYTKSDETTETYRKRHLREGSLVLVIRLVFDLVF